MKLLLEQWPLPLSLDPAAALAPAHNEDSCSKLKTYSDSALFLAGKGSRLTKLFFANVDHMAAACRDASPLNLANVKQAVGTLVSTSYSKCHPESDQGCCLDSRGCQVSVKENDGICI